MRQTSRFRWTIALTLVAGLVWVGCTDQPSDPSSLGPDIDGPLISIQSPDLGPVIIAQERHTPELMQLSGVVGTGVGLNADGRPVVKILAASEDELTEVPTELDGIPVEVLVTGRFYALQGIDAQAKPTCGKKNLPPCPDDPPSGDPRSRFDRPVPIGVSTGHPDITAGTIGARVTDGTDVFALSNNHVYANTNSASIDDAVIQPGSFDGGSSPADDIGTLADFEPILFTGCGNVMDAAIALSSAASLANATPSQGYGTPKSQTIAPALNMKVQKFGRTTGQTTGTITALNAAVNVNYGSPGVACFTGQIVITPGSFSAGGDSGSLIVFKGKGKSRADDRKPVGLLFAGSSFQTIANPIDAVLTRFGVTIDGQ
jgi:hypothetical protein